MYIYGECSSEEERRIVAPEVEISKFFTYPIWGCRIAAIAMVSKTIDESPPRFES